MRRRRRPRIIGQRRSPCPLSADHTAINRLRLPEIRWLVAIAKDFIPRSPVAVRAAHCVSVRKRGKEVGSRVRTQNCIVFVCVFLTVCAAPGGPAPCHSNALSFIQTSYQSEFASLYGHRGLAGTPPACLLSCTRYSFPSVRRGQPSIKSPIPIHTSSWGPTACSLPHSLSCCETLVASSGNLAVILPMRSCLFDNDFGRIRHIRHKSTFHDIRIGIHGTLKSPRRENTAGRAPAERSPVGIFFLHHFVPVGLASLRRASGLFIGCRRCLLFTLIFKQPIKVHVLVRHIVIR
ncbi:hypothetical protein J3A83DRAFT_1966028 [Scleroderma citrinum]